MKKVNFEPIGEALKVFDTDKMNIARRLDIQNPDGTTGQTGTATPLYNDVDCHIAFITADNPDSATAETKPIIIALEINCSLDVDLQNGDYITAKKLANDGTVLEIYTGIIGEPTVSQSRKSAQMKMRTDV